MSGHGHEHTEQQAMEMFEPPAWEERYSGEEKIWSGQPNAQLVAEVSGLAPGTALDVGCGEGGDVIWLAQQGWKVTGADFSANGLARAAGHAVDAGVAERIDWWQVDARTFAADGRSYDLVTTPLPAPAGRRHGRGDPPPGRGGRARRSSPRRGSRPLRGVHPAVREPPPGDVPRRGAGARASRTTSRSSWSSSGPARRCATASRSTSTTRRCSPGVRPSAGLTGSPGRRPRPRGPWRRSASVRTARRRPRCRSPRRR